MGSDERKRLIELLTETHLSIGAIVDGIDLETQVYESGWRVRDVLGHIGTWDRQVALSLDAFRDGREYVIPDHDEDAFNAQDVLRQSGLASDEVYGEWKRSREELKAAVAQIPPELFPGDLIYPWGDERGTVAGLIETMVEHDIEHRDEILQVVDSGE